MSLTIFIHRNLPLVGIIRWFRDPKVRIDYASGPPVQMTWQEFQTNGYEWILQHFAEYKRIRLPEEKVLKVFEPGAAKKLMKDRSAMEISLDAAEDWIFSPRAIRKYSLVDLDSLGKETHRTIPANSSPEVFWKTFEEVLTIASEA